jgi:drug/metabolite transporter (DMT)-like permease
MTWVLVALLAQFILGTSALFDKLLLKKSYPNPVGYTFWLGIFGLVTLVLLPFGFDVTPGGYILLALLAGAAFLAGMLAYVWALFDGEASLATVAVAAFSPVVTLCTSFYLLQTQLHVYQLVAFACLVLGGLLLILIQDRKLRFRMLWLTVLAGILLGFSTVLSKAVFDASSFITGFVWIKLGAGITACALLAIPEFRKRILHPSKRDTFNNKYLYIGNRAYAGVGSILVSYAVSLGIPPLVDAMTSVRLLVLFVGGWLLLGERFRGKVLAGKLTALVVISIGVTLVGLGSWAQATTPDPNRPVTWGVTFSQKFAELFDYGAGRDWQDAYDAMIDDLGTRHLRLVAYWDLIESEEGKYDFSGLDYQMRRAEEVGADVILVVGKKVPRWPECHFPVWTSTLSREQKDAYVLQFTQKVVERYKDSPVLRYWQVENEPFLAFGEGECVLSGREFLDTEIDLAKSLDPNTPILMTDSGEIGPWFRAAKRGDVFGTTMYRRVHNDRFGNFEYPLGPSFFRFKELLTRTIIGDFEKKFLVIELGMEPWLKRQPYETTPEEQFKVFDYAFFKDSIRYAKETGFDEYYLWGVEWWYWHKVKHNNPSFWEEARKLFTNY